MLSMVLGISSQGIFAKLAECGWVSWPFSYARSEQQPGHDCTIHAESMKALKAFFATINLRELSSAE